MTDNCIVVVPCYNEASRLDTSAFRRFVAEGHPQQFLFVNDGSTDDTAGVLEALRHVNPRQFDVHHLPRNRGKAEAVRQGVLHALERHCQWVGFWDADLATPLEAIPQFCELLRDNPRLQVVIGARVRLLGRNIERRFLRHCLGRLFATVASLMLRLPVYDTQCGAKLFRASPETRALFDQPFRTNWIFDVELLARFVRGRRAAGLETAAEGVYEVPLNQWRDVAGSKVKPRDFVTSLFELMQIYGAYLRPGAPVATPIAPRSEYDVPTRRAEDSHPRRHAA